MPCGCHEWTGHRNAKGYGQFRLAARAYWAHRIAYVIAKGEIPSGITVHHSCRNAWCVNPEHLVQATFAENSADGAHARWEKQRSQTSEVPWGVAHE